MKTFATISIALGSYLLVSGLLFGETSPLLFAFFFPSSRLGLPYWKEFATFLVAIVGLSLLNPLRRYSLPIIFRLPIFVALSLLLPTLFIGAYADWERSKLIHQFKADHLDDHSFFRSIREAPAGAQFYLHAAALKGCVPYAWSYREMAFYKLRPNVAINVLPRGWREMCGIRFQP
ncbi:hypothetical protein FG93_01171 [Bosea sp. LC85]|uniref:hypothetical protein n=1 Tax=Bosea sp. LC85 TaxID=1502851 RepID=UPI0004E2CCFC|nr:hypothetical protein [Bosea sp. LC85]KFC74585.1 hypothetical protein FG93_01171 [Bosea sp. LC85]